MKWYVSMALQPTAEAAQKRTLIAEFIAQDLLP